VSRRPNLKHCDFGTWIASVNHVAQIQLHHILYGTTSMSDAKDRIKDGIDDASAKAKKATERAAERVKGIGDETKSETADAVGRAKDAFSEGAHWALNVADDVAAKASDVTAGARDYAGKAVATLHEASEQAARLTRQGLRHADVVARANPGSSLALVFGAGIALGVLVSMAMGPSRDKWSFMR
jgi:ElaB/YqjD/DUF883 family membrane-anchored ribosome-binding protein